VPVVSAGGKPVIWSQEVADGVSNRRVIRAACVVLVVTGVGGGGRGQGIMGGYIQGGEGGGTTQV